jgi:hypothetical protein
MCNHWSGIVLGDYQTVMPVPWRSKFGIRYTYDVPFIQQLGWFSKNGLPDAGEMLEALFSFVKYGSYTFNYANQISHPDSLQQNNFIINLSQPYEAIARHYNDDADNNLKKAARFPLSYQPCNCETPVGLFKRAYSDRFSHTKYQDYCNFLGLGNLLAEKQMAFSRMVVDEHTGIVLASALFFKDGQRIYNIMNTTLEAGRKKSANHFLLDNVLREFAGTGLVFDFEGSDVPGIMQFYEKFGAANQPCPRLEKFNLLPFPLNKLKR